MSAEHNHPPRCCCASLDMGASYATDDDYCPACVVHGTFARFVCNCDSPNPYVGPWHAIGCCNLHAPATETRSG